MDNLDTPVRDLELSTRAITALVNADVATLREVTPEKLEFMRKHIRNYGRKTELEIKEIIQWMREKQGDLFMSPEELLAQLTDGVTQIDAIVADIRNRLLQIAFRGRISMNVRQEIANKLDHAAERARRLPAGRPNSEHPYGT